MKKFKDLLESINQDIFNFTNLIMEQAIENDYSSMTPDIFAEKVENLLAASVYTKLAYMLTEADTYPEEVIKTSLSKIPEIYDTLEDYKFRLKNKMYTINWDGEKLSVTDENDVEIFSDEAQTLEEVKEKLLKFFLQNQDQEKDQNEQDTSLFGEPSFSSEKEQGKYDIDEMIASTEDQDKKKKLVVLKNYLIPDFINIYVKSKEKREALVQTLLKHIDEETVPTSIPSSVKSTIITLFFILMDVLSDDRKLADILTTNLSGSVIYESKKTKRRRKSIVDKVSRQLEYLLRIGLTDKRFVLRLKKALTMDKVSATTIKMYRDLILDLLSEIIEYIEKDKTIYNRIRTILTKKSNLIEEKDVAELQEKVPPHFPKSLEKKLLKFYKDNPELAYATMWKIHNLRQQKKKKERE